MLRDMINKIEEMAPVQMLNYDGREYTDKPIYPVTDPLPSTINMCTRSPAWLIT